MVHKYCKSEAIVEQRWWADIERGIHEKIENKAFKRVQLSVNKIVLICRLFNIHREINSESIKCLYLAQGIAVYM